MPSEGRGILSPVRLPVPPLQHGFRKRLQLDGNKNGFARSSLPPVALWIMVPRNAGGEARFRNALE